MRDPITKLAIVTQETCDPGIAKALGPTIISVATPEKPASGAAAPIEVMVKVVHYAGKVSRKSRGVLGNENLVLVVGDQALYLYKPGDTTPKRCVPISAIEHLFVYPQSHVMLRIPTEYDLLLQFEGGTKDKESPDISFFVNVLVVLQEVLFSKKLTPRMQSGNPMEDKDVNLKKPDAFKEVQVPLTSLRVPLVKTEKSSTVENMIRPHAPAASNLLPAVLSMQNERDLSPRAKTLLDHPLLNSKRLDDDEDTENEQQQHTTATRTPAAATQPQHQHNTPADDIAPPGFPMPSAPSPTTPPPGILRREGAPGSSSSGAGAHGEEEAVARKNEELTKKLKQVEAMQRNVEIQQQAAIELVDHVKRLTSGLGSHTPSGGDAGGATPGSSSSSGGAAAGGGATTPLPPSLANVPPAPPPMLGESRRSPMAAAGDGAPTQAMPITNTAASSAAAVEAAPTSSSSRHMLAAAEARTPSPGTQTLTTYYAAGMSQKAQQQQAASSSRHYQQQQQQQQHDGQQQQHQQETPEAPVPAPLSPQDLQDEVIRRVRAAEDMFATRAPSERMVFRKFHIEQRRGYLAQLQSALDHGTKPPPPSFSHFQFEGSSERPYPIAVDVFITQQELLYLLRIVQAEQPPQPHNIDTQWSAANENVFAAQQFSAPASHQGQQPQQYHHSSDAGQSSYGGGNTPVPLEPMAMHTSPPPDPLAAGAQPMQPERWDYQQPQQPMGGNSSRGGGQSPMPRNPRQPLQPTRRVPGTRR